MSIAKRIHAIQQQIFQTAIHFGRDPNAIRLLAVSKGQATSAIREAFAAGVSNFGENYCQEAKNKIDALADLPIEWHFIGAIQSNKTAWLATHFSWIHTVSREKIAALLSVNRPLHLPPLNICIQVNLDAENSKSGVMPQDLVPFLTQIYKLPRLQVRGLMAIPRVEQDERLQYESFMRLKNLLDDCNQTLKLDPNLSPNISLDTLSMGMSDDMVRAIAAGSTCVRIGRAIFGERKALNGGR